MGCKCDDYLTFKRLARSKGNPLGFNLKATAFFIIPDILMAQV